MGAWGSGRSPMTTSSLLRHGLQSKLPLSALLIWLTRCCPQMQIFTGLHLVNRRACFPDLKQDRRSASFGRKDFGEFTDPHPHGSYSSMGWAQVGWTKHIKYEKSSLFMNNMTKIFFSPPWLLIQVGRDVVCYIDKYKNDGE